MKIGNIFRYIPGFRSGNFINMTFAAVYYVLVLILGYPSIPLIIMGLSFPAVLLYIYDLIKMLVTGNFDIKKIIPLAAASLIFALSSFFGMKDFANYFEKKTIDKDTGEEKPINKRPFESEEEYEEKLKDEEKSNPELDAYFVPATVDRIIDAETIVIVRENSIELETVKLLGIAAPEISPDGDASDFHAETTLSYARNLLKGRKVFLETDSTAKDSEGNYLFYLWLKQPKSANVTKNDVSEMMYNAQLVQNGYARSVFYPPNIKYNDWFDEFQETAKENGWGLWSDVNIDESGNEKAVPDYTSPDSSIKTDSSSPIPAPSGIIPDSEIEKRERQ